MCIIGNIKGINSSETSVKGSGLLKIVGDNLTNIIDTYQKQIVLNENLFKGLPYEQEIPFVTNTEYRGIDITECIKPYVNTNQPISVSADVKVSNDGQILFYTLGRYSIKDRLWTKLKVGEWYRLKIENTRFNYNSEHDPNGEKCVLSFYCTYGTGIIPTVKNIKIELGSKATPYIE